MSENIIAPLSQASIVGKEHINVHYSMRLACLQFVLLGLPNLPALFVEQRHSCFFCF